MVKWLSSNSTLAARLLASVLWFIPSVTVLHYIHAFRIDSNAPWGLMSMSSLKWQNASDLNSARSISTQTCLIDGLNWWTGSFIEWLIHWIPLNNMSWIMDSPFCNGKPGQKWQNIPINHDNHCLSQSIMSYYHIMIYFMTCIFLHHAMDHCAQLDMISWLHIHLNLNVVKETLWNKHILYVYHHRPTHRHLESRTELGDGLLHSRGRSPSRRSKGDKTPAPQSGSCCHAFPAGSHSLRNQKEQVQCKMQNVQNRFCSWHLTHPGPREQGMVG